MPIYVGDIERRLDAVAAAATAVLAGTLGWAATRHVSRSWPDLLLLTGAAAFYLVGRIQGRRHARPLLAVVAAAVVVLAASHPRILSGSPVAPPLHYGNANGALLVVAVVATVALAVSTRRIPSVVAWIVACAFTAATYATESRAAFAVALAAVISSFLATTIGRSLSGVIAGTTTVGLFAVIAATVLLGWTYDGPGSAPGWATSTLSERRVALWHDAVTLTRENPLQGVGLGQFPKRSPVAAADVDTQYAHSLPLELSAEAGVVAGLDVIVLVVCLAAVGAVRRRGASRVVAAWAIVGFSAQASIDYIYRYPAVVLLAALVAGTTAAVPKRVGRRLPGRANR